MRLNIIAAIEQERRQKISFLKGNLEFLEKNTDNLEIIDDFREEYDGFFNPGHIGDVQAELNKLTQKEELIRFFSEMLKKLNLFFNGVANDLERNLENSLKKKQGYIDGLNQFYEECKQGVKKIVN